METGAHSISLVAHGVPNDVRGADRIKDLIWIVEKLVRIHD